MADNFNFRKFITENKLGPYAKDTTVKEGREVAQTFNDHDKWMAAAKAAYPKADYTKGSNMVTTRSGEIKVPYEKFFQGFQQLASWDEKTGTGEIYKAEDISANVYPAGSRKD